VTSILIVCTGNLCRSPFAEGLLRRMLSDRFGRSAPAVSSAGTIARDGVRATPEAILVATEHGVDLSSHEARRLVEEHVADADLVLTMAAEHRDAIAEFDRNAVRKTFTLKELVRLLEDPSLPPAAGSDPLTARVAAADTRRGTGSISDVQDQDVADPLGHPVETYRAVDWEIATWCERLTQALFGPTGASGDADRPVTAAS
jgi:protein-tyrosine phosphatase